MGIPHEWNFFWAFGTKVSFLRYLSLASCRALHPDWPIKLWQCNWKEHKIGWGWGDFQGRKRVHDWTKEAVDMLGVQLCVYEPDDPAILTYPPPNISDIFSYDHLSRNGGWYADMDILFLKDHGPISDQDYAFIGYGGLEPWVGTFGAQKGSWVMQSMVDACKKNYSAESYNSTGTYAIMSQLQNQPDWYNRFAAGDNGLRNWNAPSDMFYPVRPQLSSQLWSDSFQTPKPMSWQVHLYGGNADYQKMSKVITPEYLWNQTNSEWVCRYVRSMPDAGKYVPKTSPVDAVETVAPDNAV